MCGVPEPPLAPAHAWALGEPHSSPRALAERQSADRITAMYGVFMESLNRSQGVPKAHFEKCCSIPFSVQSSHLHRLLPPPLSHAHNPVSESSPQATPPPQLSGSEAPTIRKVSPASASPPCCPFQLNIFLKVPSRVGKQGQEDAVKDPKSVRSNH